MYKKVYEQYSQMIIDRCKKTIVPPELIYALICLESGGKLPAYRFEPRVFETLKKVKRGEKAEFKGITTEDLVEYPPDLIQKLSASYGLTQIMGWWTVKNLPFSITGEIKPEVYIDATMYILTLPFEQQPKGNDSPLVYLDSFPPNYEACFRIWNTGKSYGETYDKNYVLNGYKAITAWFLLREGLTNGKY